MIADYLQPGPQTEITDLVKEHAEKARNFVIDDPAIASLPEPYLAIHKTLRYIHTLPCVIDKSQLTDVAADEAWKIKEPYFLTRNLDQILREGYFPTCSDYGILFRGLMVAQGNPTSYVETFHEDYLLDGGIIHDHIFSRVYFDGGSVIVDPTFNKLYDNEAAIFPYIIFKEGLDSWDMKIHNFMDLERAKTQNIAELLNRYEKHMPANDDARTERLQAAREKFTQTP